MSLLLGIDTATIAVSVAIVADGIPIASFHCAGARRQTELLHPTIELVLSAAGVAPTDLDGVVVDVGPGRFTGVRVGVAAAKGLAYGANVRTIGLLSTEILLEAALAVEPHAVAVVDLRRGEVAVAFGEGRERSEALRMTPIELGRSLTEHDRRDALLVGDGAIEYRALIAQGAGVDVHVGPQALASPSAAVACQLTERSGSRMVAVDPSSLQAVYLRGADVRLGWTTRDGAASPTRLEVG